MQILSTPQVSKGLFYRSANLIVSHPRTYAQLLDVDVCEESHGLRLTRIGIDSPLKRLSSSNDFAFYASMEIGDRLVAINGVNLSNVADLKVPIDDETSCEITVFDFRTRLTVSWMLAGRQIAAR